MIWNDPKYADAVEALSPIEWEVSGLSNKHLRRNHGGDWVSIHVDDDPHQNSSEFLFTHHIPHVMSDFEAGCILAEFAERWLAKHRGYMFFAFRDGGYCVGYIRRVSTGDSPRGAVYNDCLLTEAGAFVYIGDKSTSPTWFFANRHEALAEGILAVLRQE